MMFRYGHCPEFYVVCQCSTVVVLFTKIGGGKADGAAAAAGPAAGAQQPPAEDSGNGEGEPVVLISNAHKALRRALRDADVDFYFSEDDDEEKLRSNTGGGTGGDEGQAKPRSAQRRSTHAVVPLTLVGAARCHAVYEFLFNRRLDDAAPALVGDPAWDVPLLLAPGQFLHAGVQTLRVEQRYSAAARSRGAAMEGEGGSEGDDATQQQGSSRVVILSGILLPSCVRELCALAAEHSDAAAFDATFREDSRTVSFNDPQVSEALGRVEQGSAAPRAATIKRVRGTLLAAE
jgi:hypothetical protein